MVRITESDKNRESPELHDSKSQYLDNAENSRGAAYQCSSRQVSGCHPPRLFTFRPLWSPIRLKFYLTSGREFYFISGRTRPMNLTSKPKFQGGSLWVTQRQKTPITTEILIFIWFSRVDITRLNTSLSSPRVKRWRKAAIPVRKRFEIFMIFLTELVFSTWFYFVNWLKSFFSQKWRRVLIS